MSLLDLLTQRCVLLRPAGKNAFNEPTYVSAGEWPCRLVAKTRLFRDSMGQEVLARAEAYLPGEADCDVGWQLLYAGRARDVLGVEEGRDGAGRVLYRKLVLL